MTGSSGPWRGGRGALCEGCGGRKEARRPSNGDEKQAEATLASLPLATSRLNDFVLVICPLKAFTWEWDSVPWVIGRLCALNARVRPVEKECCEMPLPLAFGELPVQLDRLELPSEGPTLETGAGHKPSSCRLGAAVGREAEGLWAELASQTRRA